MFKCFKVNIAINFCSKCCTLRTLSRTVSVQVQSIRYEYQAGHDPHDYNPVNYQRHYHCRDLVSDVEIPVALRVFKYTYIPVTLGVLKYTEIPVTLGVLKYAEIPVTLGVFKYAGISVTIGVFKYIKISVTPQTNCRNSRCIWFLQCEFNRILVCKFKIFKFK